MKTRFKTRIIKFMKKETQKSKQTSETVPILRKYTVTTHHRSILNLWKDKWAYNKRAWLMALRQHSSIKFMLIPSNQRTHLTGQPIILNAISSIQKVTYRVIPLAINRLMSRTSRPSPIIMFCRILRQKFLLKKILMWSSSSKHTQPIFSLRFMGKTVQKMSLRRNKLNATSWRTIPLG